MVTVQSQCQAGGMAQGLRAWRAQAERQYPRQGLTTNPYSSSRVVWPSSGLQGHLCLCSLHHAKKDHRHVQTSEEKETVSSVKPAHEWMRRTWVCRCRFQRDSEPCRILIEPISSQSLLLCVWLEDYEDQMTPWPHQKVTSLFQRTSLSLQRDQILLHTEEKVFLNAFNKGFFSLSNMIKMVWLFIYLNVPSCHMSRFLGTMETGGNKNLG